MDEKVIGRSGHWMKRVWPKWVWTKWQLPKRRATIKLVPKWRKLYFTTCVITLTPEPDKPI